MMTTYDISYYTHNTYEENVREAFFSFLITPCHCESQTVLHLSFQNSLKAEVFHHQNPYGFEVTSLHSEKFFREFIFQMVATVVKTETDFPIGGELSVEEEQSLLAGLDFYIDHHLFLGSDSITYIQESNRVNLLFRKNDQTILEYLTQLNDSIYTLLEYDPEPTNVHTNVNEVLQLGRGVCQDYTHFFIGLARLNKIPCRYVTGYLNQGQNLSGSAVMHAWAEAFIPGFGWQGFDPTNNLLADIHYVKVAHGTNYSDYSPLKGVVKTTGDQKTDYGVRIVPQLLAGAGQ